MSADYPLEWIDEYVSRLRHFVFVREEDCLLIKVPNEAHKLNPSGIRILKTLFDGESILDLWRSYGGADDVRRDLYEFFTALEQTLQGCVNERRPPPAVERKPFALGFNTLPVLSEIALTYRCNLRCRFCYAGCSCVQRPTTVEMSTDEVKTVLRIIREEAQVPSVSFTGGEPTLRDDLCELTRFARRDLGMRVNLITNATRIDAGFVARMWEAGLNSAQVSIEAPAAKVHDALTLVAGSFERSIHGLTLLRDAGVVVHTNTTLNRLNAESALGMPAFVRELGLERFSMNLMIPEGSGAADTELPLTYTEAAVLLPRIQRAAEAARVEFMWYSPTPVCIFNPIQHRLGNKGCAACDGLLSVAPSGDVLPCSSWPETVGNLLHQEFREVWESRRACSLRSKEYAPPMCAQCEDFALCQSACPLYWRHFGYDELECAGVPGVRGGVAHASCR